MSTIYRMIKEKILGSVTIERLRCKGNFKRPAETIGKFNDGGRIIKKEVVMYTSVKNWVFGREIQ